MALASYGQLLSAGYSPAAASRLINLGGQSSGYAAASGGGTSSSGWKDRGWVIQQLVSTGMDAAQATALVNSKAGTGGLINDNSVISAADYAELMSQAQKSSPAALEAKRISAQRDKYEALYSESRGKSVAAVDEQAAAAREELDFAREFAQQARDFWGDYENEFMPFYRTMQNELEGELSARGQVVRGAMAALGDPEGGSDAAMAMQDAARRTEARWGERERELRALGLDPTSGRYQDQYRQYLNEAAKNEMLAMTGARKAGQDQYLKHAESLLPQLTGKAYTDAATAMGSVWTDRAAAQANMMAQASQSLNRASSSFNATAGNRLATQALDADTFGWYEGQKSAMASSGSGVRGADVTMGPFTFSS